MDLAQRPPAGVVERGTAHLVEHPADHRRRSGSAWWAAGPARRRPRSPGRRAPARRGPTTSGATTSGTTGLRFGGLASGRSRPNRTDALNRSPSWTRSGGRRPSDPAARGPGTSWKRYGSGSRPGWHTQHSPVRPVVTIVSTASAIWVAGMSGNDGGGEELLGLLGEDVRVGHPGVHRVRGDAERGQRRRDAADEADDRVLREVVHRVGRERDDAGEGAGGDDRAAAPPLHRADRGAGAVHHAVDVDRA